jgi:hypothetical protein
MNNNKIVIPKINGIEKLYIYRSSNADDINTISKVSKLNPVIVIDQRIAQTSLINMQECFVVYDKDTNTRGVEYLGPNINIIPITEYETKINLVGLNTYTFVNELILEPLPLIKKNGVMYYYSIIGVNESTNQMTHLSKVIGSLYEYASEQNTVRQVWSCNDYNDSPNDIWEFVGAVEYNESQRNICIGDITHQYNIDLLGIPFVETVPKIQNVNVSLNSIISNTFMTLEVQNPWCNNNKEFNYRKLKSFKIRNVYNSSYGNFSVPTYQSELPVSIEKMIIMMKSNPIDKNNIIPIDDEDAYKFEIIRRDGIYYNNVEHKSLGYNKWNIPLESNKLNVFSETSIQDTINIQISAVTGNLYVFDIYLIDVYEHISENTHYVLNT